MINNEKVFTPPIGSDIEFEGKMLSVVPNKTGEFGDCAGCFFFTKMYHCPEGLLCGKDRTDGKPILFKEKNKKGDEHANNMSR